jgi:hypothetical protein
MITKLLVTASGVATATAKRDMIRRVKVSVKPDINCKLKSSQNLSLP